MEGSRHFDDENRSVSLQRLTELALPRSPMRTSMHGFAASSLPIADLKGIDRFSRQEKILRNKLASLYRLVDLFQWSQGIYNHITVRHPSTLNEILINPFGLLYHEITASYLIKVDLDGEVLDQGATKLGINESAFKLHSAIHGARDDVHCVIHMHNAVVSAVSSMKCGLLPICQEAMVIGAVAYHEYQGTLDDEKERQSIIEDLGDKNVMIIRNQGFVACGQSIEEALHLAYNTILACETQILILRGQGFIIATEGIEEAVFLIKNLIAAADHQIRAARAGIEKLHIPDETTIQKAYLEARKGSGMFRSPSQNNNSKEEPEWKVGELEWEAWMRVLDNAGFRTGHFYRQPLLRQRSPVTTTSRVNGCNEVACPPASTSIGMIDESDPEALTAHKIALLRKEQEKTRWLNTPNNYQKVEILETGTDRPKVITKWVQDVSATSLNGTPVKITSNHQFSPLSVNPKEFKDKQKAIKENRRSGKTSAGPQSVILDGVTYEDLKDMKPVNCDGDSITGPADRVVLIGTASKGIIDRQHQHNAQVYRQLYAPNPFASETDEDIRKYFQEVESKSPRSQSARGVSSSRDGGYSTYRSDTTNGTSFEPDRPDTPDSPGAETTIPTTTNTASLMQGAREHRMREESSYAIDELSTSKALDITVIRFYRQTTFENSGEIQSRFVAHNHIIR
ncbi:unnamed protein product, partial [Mesorhabditis belari]|uniref:Class II aldolase/adducin N-terminal domain-containing protein n=1 Tax=Mesorhabditis belari TaxID=2138241 RepID=A0AAF3FDM0_9BILA